MGNGARQWAIRRNLCPDLNAADADKVRTRREPTTSCLQPMKIRIYIYIYSHFQPYSFIIIIIIAVPANLQSITRMTSIAGNCYGDVPVIDGFSNGQRLFEVINRTGYRDFSIIKFS